MMRLLGRRINSIGAEGGDSPESKPERKSSKLRRKASQGRTERTISIVEAKAVNAPDPPHPNPKVHFKEHGSQREEGWRPIEEIEGSDR